ncbi:MAG: hypothetical protein ACYSTT_03915 [Planctomycetota bacterium]|jgi:competence protein ComGC
MSKKKKAKAAKRKRKFRLLKMTLVLVIVAIVLAYIQGIIPVSVIDRIVSFFSTAKTSLSNNMALL